MAISIATSVSSVKATRADSDVGQIPGMKFGHGVESHRRRSSNPVELRLQNLGSKSWSQLGALQHESNVVHSPETALVQVYRTQSLANFRRHRRRRGPFAAESPNRDLLKEGIHCG